MSDGAEAPTEASVQTGAAAESEEPAPTRPAMAAPRPGEPSPPAARRPSTPRLLGPWLLLMLGVVAAVVAVTADYVRAGGYLLAASLALAGLLRALLPPHLAGAVAVRSRTTDVLLLAVGATTATVLASTLNLAGS